MSFKSFITGLAGTTISKEEIALVKEHRPCGLILFARNCANPDQLKKLINDFNNALGTDKTLILVDQEGGRVQRMRPPHWRNWPEGRAYGDLYKRDPVAGLETAELVSGLMASELRSVGINVNCVPVLDLPVDGAHNIIGDRAYGEEIETVSAVARAIADGFTRQGVLPVMKHMPGHGRALADSHKALPTLDTTLDQLRARDFMTFQKLYDLPMGMTAHILYTQIDAEHPVSTSKRAIKDIIRGELAFDGLLMSDDLSMKALQGNIGERAKNVVTAGCDVGLYCKGVESEIRDVGEAVPELEGQALARFEKVISSFKEPEPFDKRKAEQALKRLEFSTPTLYQKLRHWFFRKFG